MQRAVAQAVVNAVHDGLLPGDKDIDRERETESHHRNTLAQ